ncbi:MAG: hypothetical protein FJ098_14630 [Deltaproteobacteria bacterium]|nr:hypothetical protein [Deltaproteobacteria bacterium]
MRNERRRRDGLRGILAVAPVLLVWCLGGCIQHYDDLPGARQDTGNDSAGDLRQPDGVAGDGRADVRVDTFDAVPPADADARSPDTDTTLQDTAELDTELPPSDSCLHDQDGGGAEVMPPDGGDTGDLASLDTGPEIVPGPLAVVTLPPVVCAGESIGGVWTLRPLGPAAAPTKNESKGGVWTLQGTVTGGVE